MNYENYEIGVKNCNKNKRGGKALVNVLFHASADEDVSDAQFSVLFDKALAGRHKGTVEWFFMMEMN